MQPLMSIVWDSGESIWRIKGLPYDVRVRIGLRPDGTLICTELRLQGEELTRRGVRAIPVGEIVDQVAIALAGKLPDRVRPSAGARISAMVSWYGEPEDLLRLFQKSPPRGTRGTASTTDLLREIATAYRRLTEGRNPDTHPIKTLASRHRWSNGQQYGAANLRRLLRLARNKDLLGPAMPGKAGEKPAKNRRKR
jgi:hypothetical protein